MDGKRAGFIFLGICLLLSILLILRVIAPFTSGILFAIALVLLGGISKGFRKASPQRHQDSKE